MKGTQEEDPEGQALQDMMAAMGSMRQNRVKGLGQPAPVGMQPPFTPPPNAPPPMPGAPPPVPGAPPDPMAMPPAPPGAPPPPPAPMPGMNGQPTNLPPGMDPRLADIIRKKKAGAAA